jgi:hypothetical protein
MLPPSLGLKKTQAGNQPEADGKQGASAYCLFHADFLLGLFFDPEDGGDRYQLTFNGLTN